MLMAAIGCGRGSSGLMQGLVECRGMQGTEAQKRGRVGGGGVLMVLGQLKSRNGQNFAIIAKFMPYTTPANKKKQK